MGIFYIIVGLTILATSICIWDMASRKSEEKKRFNRLIETKPDVYFYDIEKNFNDWLQKSLDNPKSKTLENNNKFYLDTKTLPFDYNDHSPYFYLKFKYGVRITEPADLYDFFTVVHIDKNKLKSFQVFHNKFKNKEEILSLNQGL